MRSINSWLTISYLLLALSSAVIIFSIAPERFLTQSLWLILGFIIYIYLSHLNPDVFLSFAKPGYLLTVALLLITFIFGDEVRGSIRWISLGNFRLQASELGKPLLILFFANLLSSRDPRDLKNYLSYALFLFVPLFLILKQPDLGTSLVYLVIVAAQLVVAGLPSLLILAGAGLTILTARLSPFFLKDYQLDRLSAFLDPSLDPLGAGYNVIQGKIAIGSGGLFGKGLGHGTQSQLRFLPEHHTDFVFAALVEELGLIGGIFIIILIGTMLLQLVRLLITHVPLAQRLVLAGVFAYLLFQAFVNIGMNLGIAPVTGVTLPLVSYGGSSTLAVSLALGICGSIARSQDKSASRLIEIR